jgi:hypothetical protein
VFNVHKKIKRKPKQARKTLLSFVINSIIAGDWVSDTLPESITSQLMDEIKQSNGPVEWAKTQHRFKSILNKRMKKLNKTAHKVIE